MKLQTDPTTFEIATPELIPLGIDFAARLGVLETVSSVVGCTVTHIASGTVVADALSGSAALAGSIVTQMIDGSALADGGKYEYVVTVAIGSRRESTRTVLVVDF